MPLTDPRVLPLVSLRLYEHGGGDPQIFDYGFRWGWIAGHEDPKRPRGFFSTSGGLPQLEFLSGVGLVCRPTLALKDTRLTQYTTSGGNWDELRSTGSPQVYRLHQYNVGADTQWSAESTFNIPQNPSFAFSFVPFDVPADHNSTTYPPFVRLELPGDPFNGIQAYGIEFNKLYGTFLVAKVLGSWVAVMELDEPYSPMQADGDECFIFVRCHRGRLLVSTDFGRGYQVYARPDGLPVTVASGKITLRGQGGMTYFGLHQLAYAAGTYAPPAQPTLTIRTAAVGVVASTGNAPGTTSVAFTDISLPLNGLAQWRALLTPQAIPAVPFTFYQSPELYNVRFRYAVEAIGASGAYDTPYDYVDEENPGLAEATFTKPVELDGATGEVQIFVPAGAAVDLDGLRWRKLQAVAGFLEDDSTENTRVLFTGYIQEPRLTKVEHRWQALAFRLVAASRKAKRNKWMPWTTWLGGQTVNSALDECLAEMGFSAADRIWWPTGDLMILPAGSPEQPAFWPQGGDPIWEIMERIARGAGLELFTDDEGRWRTVPIGYVDPFVSHTWDTNPTEDATTSIQAFETGYDAEESATAVIVKMGDENTYPIFAFAIDTEAEANPLSERFSGMGRELEYEELPGTASPAWLASYTASRFREVSPLKWEPQMVVPCRVDVNRRDRVELVGLDESSTSELDQFAVLTLTYSFRPAVADCDVQAGLRKVVAQ